MNLEGLSSHKLRGTFTARVIRHSNYTAKATTTGRRRTAKFIQIFFIGLVIIVLGVRLLGIRVEESLDAFSYSSTTMSFFDSIPVTSTENTTGTTLAFTEIERSGEHKILNASRKDEEQHAICHRALFGQVNLTRVKIWCQYHFQLGFDHIFIWYLPIIAQRPGFRELQSLPFVTLLVEPKGTPEGNWENVNEEHESQRSLILRCLRNEANNFEWVLFSDSDEYLSFAQQTSVKDFIKQYAHLNYLSFGKIEYDTYHSTAPNSTTMSSGFELEYFPFTAGSFCRPNNQRSSTLRIGDKYCPANRGRSKVMVKPKFRNYTDIHGSTKNPQLSKGEKHFSTDDAHFKEWIGLHQAQERQTVIMEPQDFRVRQPTQVSVHSLRKAFRADPEGSSSYTIRYDRDLSGWLSFVASQRRHEGNG